jgi:hypothetical protein
MVTRAVTPNSDATISKQQSEIAKNTPEAGKQWQTIALKPPAAKPKTFVFVDDRYVKIVSDEIDPAAPRPSFHYEAKDPSNPVHVKAANDGQKNLDAFNSGLNWGVGNQLYDFTLGAGVKSTKFYWHNSYGRMWNHATGNKAELARKDAEIAKIKQDIKQIPALMANAYFLVKADPQSAVSAALNAPFIHAESLMAQGKYKEAGEFWGRALASVPLAVYSGIGSVAAVRNLPKMVKTGRKLVKTTKIGMMRLPKGIGKEGGRLPKGSAPIVPKIITATNVARVKDGKFPLFTNWAKLDLSQRTILLKESLKSGNFSEEEIALLAKMDTLASSDVSELKRLSSIPDKRILPLVEPSSNVVTPSEKNTASSTKGREHKKTSKTVEADTIAASKRNLDYVALVRDLDIKFPAKISPEMQKLFSDRIKYAFLVALRNPGCREDAKAFLSQNKPILNIFKSITPGAFVGGKNNSLNLGTVLFIKLNNKVRANAGISVLAHELYHIKTGLVSKPRYYLDRNKFTTGHAYATAYLEKRIMEEFNATRKEAIILGKKSSFFSNGYGFNVRKTKGPLSEMERKAAIRNFKLFCPIYSTLLYIWARSDYGGYL